MSQLERAMSFFTNGMEPEKEKGGEVTHEERTSIKALRTYQGDVEEAIHKNNFSATTILVAEQKRKEQTPIDERERQHAIARNKFFVMLGIILLVLGISTVGGMFYLKSRNQVVMEKKTKAIIVYTEEKLLSVTSDDKEKIINEILEQKKSLKLPVNSILFINTVDVLNLPVSVDNILSLLTPQMPQSLVRSLGKEYMLGVYSYDTNEPFIILTVEDFPNSFSGMLKWEKDMPRDLGKIFSIPTELSTSTQFKDEAIQNKDLRIYKDEKNKTLIAYSFINKNTLIITTREEILTALIGKYNVSKQVR